jgi:xanthine dehydrogenase large subunit
MNSIFKNKGELHDSGISHVKGESQFIDDRLPLKSEMMVSYLGTPVANGVIESIDINEAMKIPGVLGIFTHKDVHHNHWGTIIPEQPFLVQDKIGYIDEPVAIIATESKEAMRLAKLAIKLKITEAAPLLDLDIAIKEKSFIGPTRTIKRGEFDEFFLKSPYKLKGVFENKY